MHKVAWSLTFQASAGGPVDIEQGVSIRNAVILRDITACVKNLLKAEAVGSQNIMHAYHWSCVKEHQANWTVFPISQHALSSSSHVKIQSIPFFSQF
jgi:hypothetical protein